MSSLTIPYSQTEFGYRLAFPPRVHTPEARSVPQPVKEELVAPSLDRRDLLPSEVLDIKRRLQGVASAIDSLERQRDTLHDIRLSLRALTSFVVAGLWNHSTSWLRWGVSPATSKTARQAASLDQAVSDKVSQIKRITERVVTPTLAPIRDEYRGRTFTRDAETPKELLLISVPSEKAGKVLSFDSLRITIDTRAIGSKARCDISRGDGRIVLERVRDGVREQLEFSYKRAGKVDVYLNGERRGSMWNDDVLNLADAFLADRAIPLERRKKSEHYTVC